VQGRRHRPEGHLDDRNRAEVVADVTEAVLDAEEGSRPRDLGRVWVFRPRSRTAVGGNGRIVRLADILSRVTGATRPAALPRSASRESGDRSGIPG